VTGAGRVQAYVLLVSGRVQGVGFRWFAEREALKRNIRGYVRNLEDGRVEILAQADAPALDAFRESIGRGPSASRVDDVEVKPVDVDIALSSFRIRF
jgi:acylphosphatase